MSTHSLPSALTYSIKILKRSFSPRLRNRAPPPWRPINMWYIPFLRAWRAFATYSIIVVGVAIVGIAIRYSPGVQIRPDQVAKVSVDLIAIATVVTALIAILATVMGLSLAAENEGHLELTWTKPVSRESYALAVFGVDTLAMIAAYIVSMVAAVIVCDVWVGRQVVIPISPLWLVAAVLVLPIYVYAIIAAGSASLKRSRGMVAGLFWPVTLGLVAASFVRIDIVHNIDRKSV